MTFTPIYEVQLNLCLRPENMDAAIEELLHANSVEVVDERGVLRVVEQVVAPNEFCAYLSAKKVTEAQLEAGNIDYFNVDRSSVKTKLVSC